MGKRTIAYITGAFSVMLLGIVLLQGWWIMRSLQLNRQAFDAAVYHSLESVVKKAEEKENFIYIQREIKLDSMLAESGRHQKNLKKMRTVRVPPAIVLSGDNDTAFTETMISIEKDGKQTITIASGIGSVISAAPPMPPQAPLPPGKAALYEKKENLDILLRKMIKLADHDSLSLSPAELDSLLHNALRQSNITTPFQFALLSGKKGYIYKSRLFTDTLHAYRADLYPNDLFKRSTTLLLSFPKGADHLDRKAFWAFILSMFFTACILLLFIYSIRSLLKHKKLLEVKNDFINHISHELKTPVAAISLGADILIEKGPGMNAMQLKSLGSSIKKQSKRLHEDSRQVLLNALLDKRQLRKEQFDLTMVCREALEEMELQAEEKEAVIHILLSEAPVFITGDENLWRKVFTNLLDNALKFSKGKPEIEVKVRKAASVIRLSVSDKGSGIAQKDLSKIFDPFYRSDYYRRSDIQGFGLGLSFVKKMVQLHKGTIKAFSAEEKGTTILIELPDA